jgi:uncharacterized membrane-anchored protein
MKKKIILLLIPFVIMVSYILEKSIRYYILSKQEKIYYFPLEGYDPRDLIKGHYITFRIRYNPEVYFDCRENERIQCSCLEEYNIDSDIKIAKTIPPVFECSEGKKYCENKKFIQLECKNDRFIIPHTQYFLSEELAQYVWRLPENSYIGLRIDEKGKSQIIDIYVLEEKNFIPLLEFAKRIKQEQNKR